MNNKPPREVGFLLFKSPAGHRPDPPISAGGRTCPSIRPFAAQRRHFMKIYSPDDFKLTKFITNEAPMTLNDIKQDIALLRKICAKLPRTFGETLKYFCVIFGFSIAQLTKESGISDCTIKKYRSSNRCRALHNILIICVTMHLHPLLSLYLIAMSGFDLLILFLGNPEYLYMVFFCFMDDPSIWRNWLDEMK